MKGLPPLLYTITIRNRGYSGNSVTIRNQPCFIHNYKVATLRVLLPCSPALDWRVRIPAI